ncbi:hypothetical protein SELMODRAFT_426965 [Selaginella moellendorffii]|uniref:Uncharacterized protein n=1 Tax=Selaginella moellendorffii TaxID=88036 RepID=D8SY23_SELML|nr:hypothetical protein SELMODRAFT_426965 [Selaginella moellendorffii]
MARVMTMVLVVLVYMINSSVAQTAPSPTSGNCSTAALQDLLLTVGGADESLTANVLPILQSFLNGGSISALVQQLSSILLALLSGNLAPVGASSLPLLTTVINQLLACAPQLPDPTQITRLLLVLLALLLALVNSG